MIMDAPEVQEPFVRPVSEKKETTRDIIKTLLLVTVIAGSLAAVRFTPIWYYLDRSHIYILREEKLAAFHSLAPFVFLAGGTLVIALGVPRTIISILGGMVFGFFSGTILATAAAFAGSVVVIWITRVVGHPLFHQRIGHRLKAIEGHLRNNGFALVLILRQLPLPSMLINVLIGLSSIKTSAYVVVWSVIGLGARSGCLRIVREQVREDFALRISLASFCLIVLIIVIKIYFRRSPLARELSQKLTRDKT